MVDCKDCGEEMEGIEPHHGIDYCDTCSRERMLAQHEHVPSARRGRGL